jgi:hypothetical protein
MSSNRRDALRIPESRLITQIAKERPDVASIVNLSNGGLFTVKPPTRWGEKQEQGIVQVEIPLPEASESVWAVGEIVYQRRGLSCTGTGIRFLSMANCHQSLIKDLVEYRRLEILEGMMAELMRQKNLAGYPSPYGGGLPPLTEDTVRMFMIPELK